MAHIFLRHLDDDPTVYRAYMKPTAVFWILFMKFAMGIVIGLGIFVLLFKFGPTPECGSELRWHKYSRWTVVGTNLDGILVQQRTCTNCNFTNKR